MFNFKNILLLLMVLVTVVFFSCDASSSSEKKEEKDKLAEAQKELATHFSQDKAFAAVNAVGATAKDSAVAGHQGYLVTVGGNTYIPLNITEKGEYLVMHNDANSTEFKIVNAKGADIKIKTGDYDGKKYLVFDYEKKTLDGITDDNNIPYIKFATTSTKFTVAFRGVGEEDHDDH